MTADRPPLRAFALAALVVVIASASRGSQRAPRAADDATAVIRARTARVWAEVEASFARLDAGIAAIDAKISAALDDHPGCPSSRDRATAMERLAQLRRQQAELRRRLAKARAESTICRLPQHPVRRVVIDRACIENPLARGCM